MFGIQIIGQRKKSPENSTPRDQHTLPVQIFERIHGEELKIDVFELEQVVANAGDLGAWFRDGALPSGVRGGSLVRKVVAAGAQDCVDLIAFVEI